MKLLSRYTYFGAKAKFAAICKAGGSVDVNCTGGNALLELFGCFPVFGDNSFGMAGRMGVDMIDGFIYTIDNFDSYI